MREDKTMRKLSLALLAASAAFASAAPAQTVPDDDPAASMPTARLAEPAARAMRHPAPPAATAPQMRRRAPGPHVAPAPHHAGPRTVVREMHGPRHGPGARRFHIRRIDRGGFVPPMFGGHQFVIRDWGMYGFPQPFAGGRWIRYYDDALLVDRHGRVHDGRYGWDWGRWSDRWADRDGVPVYVGDGDYEPEDWDYEWAERWDEGDRDVMVHHGGPPMDDCRSPCRREFPGPPPTPHGYGYGHGCGCGPVVVTETVTTTAPVVETRTWYEYVDERAAPRRHYRKPVRRAAPPARPKPGERG
jgi:Ni/Co efflux regulator RcnB